MQATSSRTLRVVLDDDAADQGPSSDPVQRAPIERPHQHLDADVARRTAAVHAVRYEEVPARHANADHNRPSADRARGSDAGGTNELVAVSPVDQLLDGALSSIRACRTHRCDPRKSASRRPAAVISTPGVLHYRAGESYCRGSSTHSWKADVASARQRRQRVRIGALARTGFTRRRGSRRDSPWLHSSRRRDLAGDSRSASDVSSARRMIVRRASVRWDESCPAIFGCHTSHAIHTRIEVADRRRRDPFSTGSSGRLAPEAQSTRSDGRGASVLLTGPCVRLRCNRREHREHGLRQTQAADRRPASPGPSADPRAVPSTRWCPSHASDHPRFGSRRAISLRAASSPPSNATAELGDCSVAAVILSSVSVRRPDRPGVDPASTPKLTPFDRVGNCRRNCSSRFEPYLPVRVIFR